MIRLRILGPVELCDGEGRELRQVLAQPKRLALLAQLAAARPLGFHRRDRLLALLWPELDLAHARSALNQAVRFLRRELACQEGTVIVGRGGDELGIDSRVVWCDTIAFQSALDSGDEDEALRLYRGDLLEGFYCDGSEAFEEWLERERTRFRAEAVGAARRCADRYANANSLTVAVSFARKAVELSHWDERLVRRLVVLLDRAGDRSGAMRAYESFARQLADEYGAEPAPETQALAERLRTPQRAAAPPSAPCAQHAPSVSRATALASLSDRYEVLRALGSGGMADIYLARDVRHNRQVALKIMRDEVAAALGPDRFLREIAVTANLQHPHILSLYDSGQVDDVLYYVMPYVDGESLRERLRRERQLPIEDALQITRDVASALEYAHHRGIIHRDIKPENILIQDGQALVADFGIALAASTATEESLSSGISFGSPKYMSPERASGNPGLDPRSDVYSLAVVLHEMLAGCTPRGSADEHTPPADQQPDVPLTTLRPTVPPHVERALVKALAALPADRCSSAVAFVRALEEPVVAVGVVAQPGRSEVAARQHVRRNGMGRLLIGASLLAVLAVLLGADWTWRYLHHLEDTTRRWDLVLPDSAPMLFTGAAPLGIGRTALALSRDGTRLVYVAKRDASQQLYIRRIGELHSAPLAGTAGAFEPFFSPDGEWVGFFAGDELRKVSVGGGDPITLAKVHEPFGAAWATDGRILVAEGQGYKIGWIPVGGGAPEPNSHQLAIKAVHPALLPGDEWIVHHSLDGVLYVSSLVTGRSYALTTDRALARDSASESTLLRGFNPIYLESGHLAYFSNDDALTVVPFELAHHRVTGPPLAVLSGVRLEAPEGGAQFAVSANGTLLYAPGESNRQARFVWVDHASGRRDTLPLASARYGAFRLSPDGHRLLVNIGTASGLRELWVIDLAHGVRSQVPTSAEPSQWLQWTPDGDAVVFTEFSSVGTLPGVVVRQRLNDPSHRDTLSTRAIFADPAPDNRTLAILTDPSRLEIRSPAHTDQTLARSVRFATFSPDAKWLAYTEAIDNESEVYVTPLAHPNERYKISASGGEEPVWSPDGHRLIFRDRRRWLSADIRSFSPFRADRPRLLFEGPYLNVPGIEHDIAADGHRQLVLLGSSEESTTRLVVVTNWFAELRKMQVLARTR